MKAQLLTTATFLSALAGALPAADLDLLNLVGPDAKVLAGVNVEHAKGTLFGQYVLNQLQSGNQDMQQLIALTGFDPTRDVREALLASSGAPQTGLMLASGKFDVDKITRAASSKGAVSEAYNGVNILEDPKQSHGVAFLNPTTVAAGDLASVKGVLDRLRNRQTLPASVTVQIGQLSSNVDGWILSTVAPSSLVPAPPAGKGGQVPPVLQTVQSASGAVTFGSNVVFTGQAQTDNTASAATLRDTVRLLISLAQMNASTAPQAAQLAQQVQVNSSDNVVTVSLSLPEDQFQQLVKIGQKSGAGQAGPRRAIHQGPARQ